MPSDDCAKGCYKIAGLGGSCLCDIVVSDVAVITDATTVLPTEAELRAKLLIGAEAPEDYGIGGSYTMCTTTACTAQKGVRVYTRSANKEPKSFGADAIFELTATPNTQHRTARFPGRYLLNRASTVHVGHYQEYVLLHTQKNTNPILRADYTHTNTPSGRACTYTPESEKRKYCNGQAVSPIDGKKWSEQHTYKEVQEACARNPRCVGIQWYNRRGGSAFAGGSYKLCRSTTLVQDASWDFIPATCKSVSTGTCKHEGMTRVSTETECKAACVANGQPIAAFESVSTQYSRYGCFVIDDVNAVDSRFLQVTNPNHKCKWNSNGGFFGATNEPGFPHLHGVREMCRAKGMIPAIKLSTAPCEDRGLKRISNPAECELAAASIVAGTGETVGKGGVIQHITSSSLPEGCSMYTEGGGWGREKGDLRCYWNARKPSIKQLNKYNYSPLCHHADNESNKKKLTGFKFRNPPGFIPNTGNPEIVPGEDQATNNPYSDDDHLRSFAEYETEALIDNLLHHDNTPPFISYRIIQRMVTSNPSPRYVHSVATAFATGSYGGIRYSGEYGDMAATIAAVLLDREARATTLEMDPGHGQIREPLMKVLHVLRSLEFEAVSGMDLHLANMDDKIGQMAHFSPGVFNFYLPEFIPAGSLEDAGLVSPESQILTSPFLIGYLNGMSSLIDYGLTHCAKGFGDQNDPEIRAVKGRYGVCSTKAKSTWRDLSDGLLRYKPTNPNNPEKVIEELALLVTGGRLSAQTKFTLISAYDRHLSEAVLNVTEMKRVEQAKTKPRTPQRCDKITNKQDCCQHYDDRATRINAPNCIPGNYDLGVVCRSEQYAGYREGSKMEMCGKDPLVAMSGSGYNGAFRAIDGKYGQPLNTPGVDHGQACMQSTTMDDPWWQLDLGVKRDISSITLYVLHDCWHVVGGC